MHFCSDELIALAALIPGLIFSWNWLRCNARKVIDYAKAKF